MSREILSVYCARGVSQIFLPLNFSLSKNSLSVGKLNLTNKEFEAKNFLL